MKRDSIDCMVSAGPGHSNPWTTLNTRTVYENAWIKVKEHQVIRPDGKPGIYGVVETRIATGVVALSDDGQVYMVGQYRYPTNHYSWEIVEGGADEGESPLQAARRELREEAGVTARRWLQLGHEWHLSNCFSSEVGYVYLAAGVEEIGASPDGTEVLEVQKMPFSRCLEMVHSGEIKDAVSIIGLMRAGRFLSGGAGRFWRGERGRALAGL